MLESLVGAEHPDAIKVLHNLGAMHMAAGDFAAAETAFV